MLLITIPDQYPNYHKAVEIYTGYFGRLDIKNEATDGQVVRAGVSVT